METLTISNKYANMYTVDDFQELNNLNFTDLNNKLFCTFTIFIIRGRRKKFIPTIYSISYTFLPFSIQFFLLLLFYFLLRNKLNGKTFSYTDHLSIADKTKEWYITWIMKKHFDSENLEVVRVSKDVSGLGRRFRQVYSETKGWVEGDLTKVNPYV